MQTGRYEAAVGSCQHVVPGHVTVREKGKKERKKARKKGKARLRQAGEESGGQVNEGRPDRQDNNERMSPWT